MAERKAWRQSHLSFDDLVKLEQTEERTEERPTELAFEDIWTAEDAFQPRRMNGAPYLDRSFAKHLAEEISKQNGPLKPIKVVPIGQRFFVIDGHHRLMAYAKAKWNKPIPVEVFVGTVLDAKAACSEENHQEKLPMSREDKSEWSWQLVKLGLNQKKVNKSTGASERQFYIMKKKYRELGPSADSSTWAEILRRDRSPDAIEYEDWVDVKAKEMADLLAANIDRKTLRNVEVFSRMIEIVSKDLQEGLVGWWAESFRDYIADLEEFREIEGEARGYADLDI